MCMKVQLKFEKPSSILWSVQLLTRTSMECFSHHLSVLLPLLQQHFTWISPFLHITNTILNKSTFSFLHCCKHDTALICCWSPCCCGYASKVSCLLQMRHAAIDQYCLPTGPTTVYLSHAAAVVQDETDRQTDRHQQFHRPCFVYYVSSDINYQY